MILTFFILLLITASGAALTYLYEKDDALLARLAAGNVIGSAVFGTAGFLLACAFGLNAGTALAALAVALLPLVLLKRRDLKERFRRDRQRARNRLETAGARRFLSFLYYAAIFVALWFFFERAMIETDRGILTGGSNNLGDLPFHLGAIFSFTDGGNFPPENPSFAFAKFTYPFLVDFITACFAALGATVRDAMLVQNALLGVSLVVLLEKLTVTLTGDRAAGKIAPLLLFLSGGLGFVWFFRDAFAAPGGFSEFLWKLPNDYTINEIVSTKADGAAPENFRWGNSLTTLFLTQRSLLFGLPLALIALGQIWNIFAAESAPSAGADDDERNEKAKKRRAQADRELSSAPARERFPFAAFFVGLLAGTLPLIHVHSLAALFVVCAFLFFFRTGEKWREWIAFAAGVALVAVPELVFVMTGSASNLKQFIGWHFGWDSGEQNFFAFWAKNTGLFFPLLAAGLYLVFRDASRRAEEEPEKHKDQKTRRALRFSHVPRPSRLLLFYLPFAFLFLVSNTVKLAPWEWDNIKVLIYWFVASLPFVALLLARMWRKDAFFKAAAALCFLVLTLAGAIDVWRTISGQINYEIFSADAVKLANQLKTRTPPGALFLNAPTYNSAIVLTGRRSLMRFTGHLSSYGIDYGPRRDEVREIYAGGAGALALLRKNNIDYVIISPEERAYAENPGHDFALNEEFFARFPIVAEVGDYRVYRVK